jgi:hypothetical protein
MSMLDLATFNATKLCRDPFDFLVVPGFVKVEARAAINADFPRVDLPGSYEGRTCGSRSRASSEST